MILQPAIRVDFNNCDKEGRVRLITAGALAGLASTNTCLKTGTELHLVDDDLQVNGRAEFSAEENIWTARFNFDELVGATNA